MKKVRKAVIPVAGLGTRFLPATKAVAKEMLPIVDIPAIQVVIEEAVNSGIEEVILVTSRGKDAIMDHFDDSYELISILESRGKSELAERVRSISNMVRPIAIRQKSPLGLGHAVLCAKSVVGDEPFVVILPDDIIDGGDGTATGQLIDQYENYGAGCVALMKVPDSDVSMYGIIDGDVMDNRTHRVHSLVEKPELEVAPSNLAVIGRYLLPPEIFGYIEATDPGHGGEIQLTDALQKLAANEGLVGYEFDGMRHDIGDKLGFLKANIEYALKREDLGPDLRDYLTHLLNR
jgi:UTP--glucose-1-phosphate uridylyltransferase